MNSNLLSQSHQFDVMGTLSTINVFYIGHQNGVLVENAIEQSCQQLIDCDNRFSAWKQDSELSRYRGGELSDDQLSRDFLEILKRCHQAKELSQGWFDPWSLEGGFDPTGLVKGWAIQQAISKLKSDVVFGAVINVGGDIAVCGRPNDDHGWHFAVQSPFERDKISCILEVDNSIATSGGYERAGELIDPFLKIPCSRLASATVVGPDLCFADAFATSLCIQGVQGLTWLKDISNYGAVLIDYDGESYTTEDLRLINPRD